MWLLFFFQAEDGIRDIGVTGVQTCALPILVAAGPVCARPAARSDVKPQSTSSPARVKQPVDAQGWFAKGQVALQAGDLEDRKSVVRERVGIGGGAGAVKNKNKVGDDPHAKE